MFNINYAHHCDQPIEIQAPQVQHNFQTNEHNPNNYHIITNNIHVICIITQNFQTYICATILTDNTHVVEVLTWSHFLMNLRIYLDDGHLEGSWLIGIVLHHQLTP